MLQRVVFYIFNHDFFGPLSFHEVLIIFICGVRVDISSLIYANFFFIILFNIPLPFRYSRWYRIVLFLIFIIPNLIIIFINTGDIFLFPFNGKRFSAETLKLFQEFVVMLPQYIHDYWYGLLIFLLLGAAIGSIFYRINRKNERPAKFNYAVQSLLFILILGLSFLGARGSIGTKPLMPITIVKYIDIKKASIATNSIFTLIHSYNKTTINNLDYFSEPDLKKHFNLERSYNNPKKKINVVIIILESFSREFTGFLNDGKGYTPFLDSLSKNSLVCTNAFADAERSIKGVSAIIAGFPNLMEEDIQSSPYQMNCIPGIGSYLKESGYHTSFFHGGTNGTMNFDVFTKACGFDYYYGRNEFGNDQYFDGMWGIRDEEFFQYFESKINSFQEPFCSVIFSLSSHHPYTVPEKYKNKFVKGSEKISESIGYTDYSLRMFFEKASKEKWFNRTLFIISADHSFPTANPEESMYSTTTGHYAIPILFHFNNSLKGRYDSIMQQHDILPTVLDLIGYSEKFKSFGNSIFTTSTNHYSYFQINNIYHIFDQNFLLLFHEKEGSFGLYSYKTDLGLKNNLISMMPEKKMELETKIKAILQTHNEAVLKNKLCP